MALVFSTRNAGKVAEMKALLPGIEFLSLDDVHFHQEIAEPFETFQENALVKAQTIFEHCGYPTLSDDSGLCVTALAGAPGVHSAYYGGEHGHAEKNIAKLLENLKMAEDRSAYFICMLCLVTKDATLFFEGRCNGQILQQPVGHEGFGYDPIFVPDGFHESFAQLSKEDKNAVSHRGSALQKLADFLRRHPEVCGWQMRAS